MFYSAKTCVVILMKKVKRQRKRLDNKNEEINEFLQVVPREKANAKRINELLFCHMTQVWRSPSRTWFSGVHALNNCNEM